MTRQIVIKLNYERFMPLIERNMVTSKTVSEYVGRIIMFSDHLFNSECVDGCNPIDKLSECLGMTRAEHMLYYQKLYIELLNGDYKLPMVQKKI